MQQSRAVELGTGLFVFLGVAALLFLLTQTTDLSSVFAPGGYRVTARFDNVGGLQDGAPVTMAGVTIGRVEKIAFDPQRLNAVVTLRIDGRYDRIPADSDASILTSGLLGGQYVGLGPGGMDTYLSDGDTIQITQSAIILENLIGKYLLKQSGGQSD